jgi:hypothetical protein
MFAAAFFISIGALMDISLIPIFIIPATILILASFASKFLIVTGILVKAKTDNTTALRTGLRMTSAKGGVITCSCKGRSRRRSYHKFDFANTWCCNDSYLRLLRLLHHSS